MVTPRIVAFYITFSTSIYRIEAKLEHWYVTGLRQQNTIPSLVASIGNAKSCLLKIEFETNPEDSTVDQSLIVESQPVEIIYDAVSSSHCELDVSCRPSPVSVNFP